LQTSLAQWRRDAELALERGDDELLCAGLDSFAALREALPTKLRSQVEDELPRLGSAGEQPTAELEPLGEPSMDYDANERVDLLEVDVDTEVEIATEQVDEAPIVPTEIAITVDEEAHEPNDDDTNIEGAVNESESAAE
jgi:hypothetical protein